MVRAIGSLVPRLDDLVITYYRWLPPLSWEDLEYDIARAFEGQMKNLNRVWEKYNA